MSRVPSRVLSPTLEHERSAVLVAARAVGGQP